MASQAHLQDDRFDAAEADVDRGTPWMFREPDAPNPLTIAAADWSTGHTKLGEAEFLNGVDRTGKRWSVLVGCVVLRKTLIEGLVEEWDDERRAFVVAKTLGRVRPGEVVSMKYLGDREGVQYEYPDFRVSRKPPSVVAEQADTSDVRPVADGQDDDIPF